MINLCVQTDKVDNPLVRARRAAQKAQSRIQAFGLWHGGEDDDDLHEAAFLARRAEDMLRGALAAVHRSKTYERVLGSENEAGR